MGMSTHVEGFKPADAKWEAMRAVWNACKLAGVAPPAAVEKFFDGEEPDSAGVKVYLDDKHPAISKYHDDNSDGYEVDLRKLDRDIKILRFVNSY